MLSIVVDAIIMTRFVDGATIVCQNTVMNCDGLRKRAFSNFFMAHGRITKEIERRMSADDVVSLEVYDVLLALENSPEQRLRMSELAEEIFYSRSGLTRLADRIEQKGLIRRVACPNDRRAMHVEITELGISERLRAWPTLERSIKELFGDRITDDEASSIEMAFAKVLLVANSNPSV